MNYFLWDEVHIYVEEFLYCLPVKQGTKIIAVCTFIYGAFGACSVLSFCLNFKLWKDVYAKKFDLLIYLMVMCGIISICMIAGTILIIGTWKESQTTVIVSLWLILLHLCLYLLCNLMASFYCVFVNQQCCNTDGIGFSLMCLLLTFGYTVLWYYFILIINSTRIDMWLFFKSFNIIQ